VGDRHISCQGEEDQATLAEREARERVSRMEAKSAATLASARREAEGFTHRITPLEGELAEVRQARDTTEANSQGLFNMAADTEQRWEESERECQEWVQELILLQTQGFELCQVIVHPPRVRSHLLEEMWIAALRHTEMVDQLATLWVVVSFAMQSVLERLPTKALQVDVVDELVTEF
jgi:chromosome segregation ATPase